MSELSITRLTSTPKRRRYLDLADDPEVDNSNKHQRVRYVFRPQLGEKEEKAKKFPIVHKYPIVVDANVFVGARADGDPNCRRILAMSESDELRMYKTPGIAQEINYVLNYKSDVLKLFENDDSGRIWALGVLGSAYDAQHFTPSDKIYRTIDPNDGMYVMAWRRLMGGSGGRGSLITLDERDLISLRLLYPELQNHFFKPEEFLDIYPNL